MICDVNTVHPDVDRHLQSHPPFFRFDTQDGLYDLAWSEIHENQLVTGSGDGSIKLWDVTLKVCTPKGSPFQTQFENSRSVSIRTFQYEIGMSTGGKYSA